MTRMVCVGLALMALTAMAAEPDDAGGAPPALVQRFLDGQGPALERYRARRTLTASSRGGKMRAELEVLTSFDPERGMTWEVIDERGSGLIRGKVLKAALEAEAGMARSGEAGRGALAPANYAFETPGDPEAGLVRVGIRARRKDTLLLNGTMTLAGIDGDLTRVEGLLVKRPSFWTRRVWVEREYGRVAGVRVPLRMASKADVLMAGASEFTMVYHYESVNGVELAAAVASR